jgi:sulfur relay (sulfurtransferase) complex TusBCD TusD component (DsrE family)
MNHQGKKLGIMIGADPASRNFNHGIELAREALKSGLEVYVYCIDEGVRGVEEGSVQSLKREGAKLFACAYSLQKRNLPLTEHATMSGLTILNDVISSTDRFVSFT